MSISYAEQSTGNLRSLLRSLRKTSGGLSSSLSAAEANGLKKEHCIAVLQYIDDCNRHGRPFRSSDLRHYAGLSESKTGRIRMVKKAKPSTRPKVTKSPPASSNKVGVEGSIAQLVDSVLDTRLADVEAKIDEAVANSSGGASSTFVFPDREPVVLDKLTHEVLPDLVDCCNDGFNNLLLVGPAGTGKTTLAEDLAKALDLPFGSVSCTAGLSESVFTGRILPTASGEWTYRSTEFVKLFTEGGVFLADEWDAADPNLLTLVNSALANGRMSNAVSGETMIRHKDFIFVAAGNTWGYGADRTYVGRNPIDGATMDRTVGAKFHVDYSVVIEDSIFKACKSDKVTGDELKQMIHSLRRWIKTEQASYIVGTRAVVAAVRLANSPKPKNLAEILARLTIDWSPSHQTAAQRTALAAK